MQGLAEISRIGDTCNRKIYITINMSICVKLAVL